jgi:hypothetical protein
MLRANAPSARVRARVPSGTPGLALDGRSSTRSLGSPQRQVGSADSCTESGSCVLDHTYESDAGLRSNVRKTVDLRRGHTATWMSRVRSSSARFPTWGRG